MLTKNGDITVLETIYDANAIGRDTLIGKNKKTIQKNSQIHLERSNVQGYKVKTIVGGFFSKKIHVLIGKGFHIYDLSHTKII